MAARPDVEPEKPGDATPDVEGGKPDADAAKPGVEEAEGGDKGKKRESVESVCVQVRPDPRVYRGTSPVRNRLPLGTYSRTMPRVIWLPQGGGHFIMSGEPLQASHLSGPLGPSSSHLRLFKLPT